MPVPEKDRHRPDLGGCNSGRSGYTFPQQKLELLMEDSNSEKSPEEDITLTADALKAMGHPLRWKILCTLGNKEMSVGEIVEKIGTSQSNVSQHLDQLRNKNIVKSRRDANRIYYRVRNEELLELISTMRGVLCHTNLNDGYTVE